MPPGRSIRFRKTWPKEPEDRIEASLVGLAEGGPEDVDRLANSLAFPKDSRANKLSVVIRKG